MVVRSNVKFRRLGELFLRRSGGAMTLSQSSGQALWSPGPLWACANPIRGIGAHWTQITRGITEKPKALPCKPFGLYSELQTQFALALDSCITSHCPLDSSAGAVK